MFERKFIEKLNYCVDKDIAPNEVGGLLNALQLTTKFESFKDIRFQTGMLFYVPPYYTSKFDPTTGFVNCVKFNRKWDSKKCKNFIGMIDAIRYNREAGYFEFDIDNAKYNDTLTDCRTKWRICSVGNRVDSYKCNNVYHKDIVNITDKIKHLLNEYNIDYCNDTLLEDIMSVENPRFYKEFARLVSLVGEMRYNDGIVDEIHSPVLSKNNDFYITNKNKCCNEPISADANGAYGTALKGLMIFKKIQNNSDNIYSITVNDWFKFIQNGFNL